MLGHFWKEKPREAGIEKAEYLNPRRSAVIYGKGLSTDILKIALCEPFTGCFIYYHMNNDMRAVIQKESQTIYQQGMVKE